uniref:Putative ovule protein n=1 Tax=Solanum chacoense TaxID=4108 RepID=A0A0V0HSX1_SOLCH
MIYVLNMETCDSLMIFVLVMFLISRGCTFMSVLKCGKAPKSCMSKLVGGDNVCVRLYCFSFEMLEQAWSFANVFLYIKSNYHFTGKNLDVCDSLCVLEFHFLYLM